MPKSARSFAVILVALIAVLFPCRSLYADIPESERAALVALYNTTNGANWTVKTGWLGPRGTECDWHGVLCNPQKTAVWYLDLSGECVAFDDSGESAEERGDEDTQREPPPPSFIEGCFNTGNNLSGTLPDEIGQLINLRQLRLGHNSISGSIPNDLGKLTRLQELSLGFNLLSGSIPDALGSLRELRLLDLFVNQLEGELPTLSGLTNLQLLDVGSNYLTGSAPEWLAGLPRLRVLDIGFNQFEGTIPDSIGRLNQLEYLGLGGNFFEGPVPQSLGDLTELGLLDLAYLYSVTGPLPDLSRLRKLEQLYVSETPFDGPLPAWIGDLSSLRALFLSGSQFKGRIPREIGDLSRLEYLSIYFADAIEGPLPDEIGNLPRLSQLSILYSPQIFGGRVPESLFRPPALRQLVLGDDEIRFLPPRLLGNKAPLVSLDLSYNALVAIPDWVSDLTYLSSMNVNGNSLTELPETIGRLHQLESLSAYYNRLTRLPDSIGELRELRSLDVGSNELDTFPEKTLGLSNLRDLDLIFNSIPSVPEAIGGLANLETLELWGNPIGSLPESIGSLSHLRYLDLDETSMTRLPDSFANLTSLETLYCSGNDLQELPPSFERLISLSFLALSWNPSLFRTDDGSRIPVAITRLPALNVVDLGSNEIGPAFPPEILQMNTLRGIYLWYNKISEELPPDLQRLRSLRTLHLFHNEIPGSIPTELGALSRLIDLNLGENRLTGGLEVIPTLEGLSSLNLSANAFVGEIPDELLNMEHLGNYYEDDEAYAFGDVDLSHNGLHTSNAELAEFLDSRYYGYCEESWSATQTVPPIGIEAAEVTASAITLAWTPIEFSLYDGGYEILLASEADGPDELGVTLDSKTTSTFTVEELEPAKTYYISMRTISEPFEDCVFQQNRITSDLSERIAVTTTPSNASGKRRAVKRSSSGSPEGSGGSIVRMPSNPRPSSTTTGRPRVKARGSSSHRVRSTTASALGISSRVSREQARTGQTNTKEITRRETLRRRHAMLLKQARESLVRDSASRPRAE